MRLRAFVASWFFPPATSSEGIVAFKLLSNSEHQYDVCSSLSRQWGYDAELPLTAPNITAIHIDTDDVDEWVDAAVEAFEDRHAQEPYDFVMTRSMPPESIEIGRRIKENHPEIPWVASLGDPISRVPHMMRDFLDRTTSLTKAQKAQMRRDLSLPRRCDQWIGVGDAGIDILCRYKGYEATAICDADMLVFPNGPQASYMLCGLRRKNVCIIPHTYDERLYPEKGDRTSANRKVELVFLGQAYKDRSVEPFIHALHLLQINNPSALEKLHVRFIGGITDDSKSLVWNYYLNECVSIEPGISYLESLKVMAQADWLLHVDGYFKAFASTGGSVYLAGKLADYIGARKPILAISGVHSPADRLIRQYGGLVYDAWNKASIADAFERIALGTQDVEVNEGFAREYSAPRQAQELDKGIARLFEPLREKPLEPAAGKAETVEKLLSICVPSYNVEATLPRCLDSLVACDAAGLLDVMVVNDGSHDGTKSIALSYQGKYPGIIRLIDKENGGHGSTINKALEHATGRYFRVLDGDDWLDPDELDGLLGKLAAAEGEIDLVSTDYCQINMETGKIDRIRKKDPAIEYDVIYRLDDLDITKEYFSLGSITYRTGLLRDCKLRLSEHSFYVDVQYQMYPLPWVRTVMFTSGNLYHYAIGSSEQSVSQTSFVARYDNHDKIIRGALDYYLAHESEMMPGVRAYYETLILKHFIKTQLIIALQYDDDRNRGLARAKDFDSFLKSRNEKWHRKAGELYSILIPLRKCAFDPDQAPNTRALKYKEVTAKQKIARKAARKIMSGGIGTVVANEVAKKQRR